MASLRQEFPRLKSVKLVVEERRIGWEVDPQSWRTHVYRGLDELPKKLRPAFGTLADDCEVDVMDVVATACKSGGTQARFELPYRDNTGRLAGTVLRTVTVELTYRKEARLSPKAHSARCGVSIPLLGELRWSRVELHRAECEVAAALPKMSAEVIRLAVRLAQIETPPPAGRAQLRQASLELLKRRPTHSGN
jgi:hypothetical protein